MIEKMIERLNALRNISAALTNEVIAKGKKPDDANMQSRSCLPSPARPKEPDPLDGDKADHDEDEKPVDQEKQKDGVMRRRDWG